MATINLTLELALKLITRLQKEYGETSASNFALDLLLDDALEENSRLKQMLADKQEHCVALQKRCATADENNEELRKQLDSKRGDRFVGPQSKTRRKAEQLDAQV